MFSYFLLFIIDVSSLFFICMYLFLFVFVFYFLFFQTCFYVFLKSSMFSDLMICFYFCGIVLYFSGVVAHAC